MTNPSELRVQVSASAATTALVYASPAARLGATLVLAHGAGAGQRSPLIVDFAGALSDLGLDLVTFNFLYTEQRRRVPDHQGVLESCYRAALDAIRREIDSRFLFIGGKSMGGRIATHVAAADPHLPLTGLVLIGYPLHPPGRPAERRDAHLAQVGRPMLVLQGSRDAFGTPAEFEPLRTSLAPALMLHVVEGGDHSFKLSRKDTEAQEAAYADAQRAIVTWIRSIIGTSVPATR